MDIVDLISQYTELRQISKGYNGKCPLHEGDGPNTIWVTENPGWFYCFSCGATGNAIHFYAEAEKISFNEAVEKIAEINNIDIGKNEEWRKQKSYTEQCEQQARQWHSKINQAYDYLTKERKLTDEIIREFNIGFCSDLANDNVSWSPDKKERYRGISGVSFPIRDVNGRTIAFAYRTQTKAKYINSMNNDFYVKGDVLFNADKAKRLIKDRLYVVEGYMDAISCHQQGVPCVAYCGAMLTKEQVNGIKSLCKGKSNVTIYLAPDNDDTGMNNVERMREKLKILNMPTRVVEIP